MSKKFLELVKRRALLCDGGMGTMLYNKGVYINACFDELNLTNPDIVKEVQQEYVQSGVDIIETNTFGANRFKLKKFGLEDKVQDINRAGALIARETAGKEIFVAGSIGPLGLKIEPWGQTTVEEAEEAFVEQAQALLEGGVDLFILETFSDINEIHQAIKAVQKLGQDLTIVAEMTIEESGNSLYGTTPEVFTRKLEEWKTHVVGLNCSVGPAHMIQCIEKMSKITELPLSAMPNAGIPSEVEGRNIYLCSPEYMAEYAKRFILNGVKVVGGCCGTTPSHIKAMRSAIKALQPPERKIIQVLPPTEVEEAKEMIKLRDKSKMARKVEDKEFVVSVEIVPPRGHNPSRIIEIARRLEQKGIDCVNIPDGPRASARMSSMALSNILSLQTEIEPILHYTCRDRNLLGMQSDLLGMYAQGIRNLLIITGDPPKLGDYPDATAVFDVDSIGLTNVVNSLNKGIDIGGKRLSEPTGFHIGVGANPGAINIDYEISRFEQKVEAGAEFAITQPVFDIKLLENFLKRIEHCRIPLLGGIWPLFSLRNAEFMHNEVPGCQVPRAIMDRMRDAQELGAERARKEGVAIAQEILGKIKNMIIGVQISPPLGKYELALEVLKVL
ncbi:MAG: bifunctional homocysteine S-methyltransferase/methylenetetrahydrofolate reductase [Candidatus Aminicenantes bacterium]|nr:bifunctional homocysteine S-methyltransferase/methylenetetrahydrofolate reductase [Candidatus Aminicenantes bacterium]